MTQPACQLRDERYSEDEAQAVLARYQEQVGGAGDHPYTAPEAREAVRQAWSRPPREPSGEASSTSEYSWNDAGNAERLVARHGEDLVWVTGYGGWHSWSGQHWESNNPQAERWAKDTARSITTEAQQLFRADPKAGATYLRFATQSANASKLAAMLRVAQSEPDMSRPAVAFDANPRLLVCGNGAVELGEHEVRFREHRRDDYARLAATAIYRAHAEDRLWTAFLERTLPDPEVRRYLQKLVGASIQGGNPERLLIFLLGPTSTGKSTFIEAIGAVLGDYAGTFTLNLFREKAGEGPRPDMVRALSQRLIFTTEANSEWRLHADLIKRLTGGDTVKARKLFSDDFVEKVPDFTPWIATNRPPTVEHADAALWRRMVAVPFVTPLDPAAADVNFKQRLLDQESAGILGWALAGWNAYRQEGLLDQPAAVVEETIRLRESLSDLDAFLAEHTESGTEYWSPFADLYAKYDMWFLNNRVPEAQRLSFRKLADELEARGYPRRVQRVGSRADDHKVNGRSGLRLRKADDNTLRVPWRTDGSRS